MLVFRGVIQWCFFEKYQYFQLKLGKFQLAMLVHQRVEVVFFPKTMDFSSRQESAIEPSKKEGWVNLYSKGCFCILQIARAIAVQWLGHDKIEFFSNVRKSLAICDVQVPTRHRCGFSHHFPNIWAMNKYLGCLGYIEDYTYPDMWGL